MDLVISLELHEPLLTALCWNGRRPHSMKYLEPQALRHCNHLQ